MRTDLLENLLDGGVVPVVAPIAVGDDGASYNVNADTTAGAIATALQARCLLLLTDPEGGELRLVVLGWWGWWMVGLWMPVPPDSLSRIR